MKVVITGGAGFIGSHVAELFLTTGHTVIIVDDLSRGKRENIPNGAMLYQVNICGPELTGLFEHERPQAVIHLAAQVDVSVSVGDPLQDAQVNIIGSLNLFETCRRVGVRRVVYSSSAAVYGEPEYLPIDEGHRIVPQTPYGISKYVPEMYLQFYREVYGLEYTVVRYSNVYGPRQDATGEGGVVAIFLDRLLRAESPAIYGNGEQTRDFVYVNDVARANLIALEKGSGEIVNISSGTRLSVNELYRLMNHITGAGLEPRYLPPRPGDILHSCLANKRATEVLGWEPEYSLVDGLEETLRWAKERSKGVFVCSARFAKAN